MQIACTFINELGNSISMVVTFNGETVTIYSTGPNSEVEHTWTNLEALRLVQLLTTPMVMEAMSKKT